MLVAMVGVRGAPGVSTLSVALSHVWPRAVVLAELDPAGATLPYWLQAASGPLSARGGVVDLAVQAASDSRPEGVLAHAQVTAAGTPVLVGPPNAAAAAAISTWPAMASMFGRIPDTDVVADCGRFVTSQSVLAPVVTAADAVVVVTRTSLAAVAGLPETLSQVARARAGLRRVHVVVMDPSLKRAAASHEGVRKVLESKPGLADVSVHVAPWDVKTARACAGEGRTVSKRRRLLKWSSAFAATLSDESVRDSQGTVPA